MYRLCLDCYVGREVAHWEPPVLIPTQKQYVQVELSDVWIDGYLRADRFFVYILELGKGDFYIGHTKDIRKRLSEFRGEKTPSTAGGNPKLQYLQVIATEKAAELREAELKRLMETNPSQIHLMISEFHRHMREFGLE